MKKSFLLLVMAATVLAACTKEQPTPDGPVIKTVLSIGSADTKTTLGELDADNYRQLYWANGDAVAANGKASQPLTGITANTVTRADFSFTDEVSAPYNVVYPASIYRNSTSITLPHNAGDQVIPMGGQSQTASFSLEPLTSILQLKIKQAAENPDTDNIVLIEVSNTENVRMSGNFTINYEAATISHFANPTGNDLSVQITGDWALSSEERSFFIPVPARTYNFTVKVMDKNGHYMTVSTTSPKIFTKGVIKPIKAFEFIPSATDGIEIDSPETLIAFAQAYNNGDYQALGQNLVATVTADLVFDATTSEAFNATGGIGRTAAGGLFNGVFDGGNHTISGLTATAPLFNRVGTYGTVKNLTIDDSCTFTFTHSNTAELDAGSVVGYHKGTIDHVTVEADVALAAVSGVSYDTCLGGIVGRVKDSNAIVDNSNYSGAVSVPAGFQAAANRVMIGGIAGWISETGGTVQNSDFEGTIDNQGQMIASEETNEMKSNPYLMIGGIVGLNQGTVEHCSTANHATGVTVTLSENNYTGTIVTHSINAYHYAIAGIAGRNNGMVKGSCTNNATILNIFSAARGTSGNLNGRYLNVGGIVGYNASDATVSGGDNYGAIIDRASPKIHYVGGIVGRNYGAVSDGANKSTGTISVGTSHFDGPYSARQLYLGGCIGYNESTGTIKDGLSNAANLTVDALEDVNSVISAMGGVVGWSKAAIDGSTTAITNSGNLQQTNGNRKLTDPTSADDYGFYLGGVVGYGTMGLNSLSNTGNLEYICTNSTHNADWAGGASYVYLGGIVAKMKTSALVDVQYCTNSGNVTFNPTSTAPHTDAATSDLGVLYYRCYLGGIAGYVDRARIFGDATTKTTNSGIIFGGSGNKNVTTSETFWVGGIVGKLYGSACSISYCELIGSGKAQNNHWCNKAYNSYAPMCGGIVGEMYSSNGTISHCAVASTASVVGTRGDLGGIAAYARAITISDCTVPINFGNQSSYCDGGIVAWLRSGTVKDCTYSGSTIRSSQLQYGGGIVGYLQSSTIDGCSSYATDVSKNGTAVTAGALAGQTDASSTVKNSHYKSTMSMCGDANFTDGGGNAANL